MGPPVRVTWLTVARSFLIGFCLLLAAACVPSSPPFPGREPTVSTPTGELSASTTPAITPILISTSTPRSGSFAEQAEAPIFQATDVVAAIVDGVLAVIDLAEGEPKPLLSEGLPTYTQLYFVWSPDGKSILHGRLADLWFVDAENGRTWNLTNTPDRWELLPAISPDGKRIAFTSRPLEPQERGKTENTMFGGFGGQFTLVHSDGSNYQVLDRQGTIRSSPPSWSPDSSRLIYAADGELYLYELGQEQVQRIPLSDYGFPDFYACSPSWSPRGDEIAFLFSTYPGMQETSAEKGYAILNLTQHSSRIVKRYTVTETMPYEGIPPGERIGGCAQARALWHPSGDYLLLRIVPIPRANLPSGLSVIDDQGKREWTLTGIASAYQAGWSPDGKWVVFVDDGRSLNVVDPFDPAARYQILPPLCCSGVAWRP